MNETIAQIDHLIAGLDPDSPRKDCVHDALIYLLDREKRRELTALACLNYLGRRDSILSRSEREEAAAEANRKGLEVESDEIELRREVIEEALEWAGIKTDVPRWAQAVIDNLKAFGFDIVRNINAGRRGYG